MTSHNRTNTILDRYHEISKIRSSLCNPMGAISHILYSLANRRPARTNESRFNVFL